MVKAFLILLSLWSSQSIADVSLFEQITAMRFGNEKGITLNEGTVDVSDIGEDEYYHVQGQVLFFPGEFLTSTHYSEEEFERLIQDKKPLRAAMSLRGMAYSIPESPINYGTCLLRIKSRVPKELMLAVPRFYHAIDLFMATAKENRRLLKVSKVDPDPKKNASFTAYAVPNSLISIEGDLYLTAHISSPLSDGKNLLNFSSFYLGDSEYLGEVLYHNRLNTFMILGAFAILAIYYAFVFSFRRQDKSSLYLSLYALFSLIMSLRFVVHFGMTPRFMLDLFIACDLLTIWALQYFALAKIQGVFPKRMMTFFKLTAVLMLGGAAVALHLHIRILIGVFIFIGFATSTVLIIMTCFLGFKHKLEGIWFFLCGVILNIAFQAPAMINFMTANNRETAYLILLANLCMAISLALVNAKEFAATYQKSLEQSLDLECKNQEISFFNKNLEKMVNQKTRQIRSLLDYIPQGVLSLASDGTIEKDYSAHLKNILETDAIAHRSFLELVLDRAQLAADEKDQIWQALLASVGEHELNFELNDVKLPSELLYLSSGKEKALKVTWNAEVEHGNIVRLLVTLLDITSEKSLEKEAAIQRQELSRIQELLNVPADQITRFKLSTISLLQENERIIASLAGDHNLPAIRTLFLNAHTVKGAARSLQLKGLATALHEMEEYYSLILRNGSVFEKSRLQRDFKKAFAVFQDYIEVNDKKLNRIDNYTKINFERATMERHYRTLKNLTTSVHRPLVEVIAAIQEQCDILGETMYEQLSQVFQGYKQRMLKIAKDLGKEEPNFDLKIPQLTVTPHLRTILDQCLLHILSNAVDHGIESKEERRDKGKPDSGTIFIAAHQERDLLHLVIKDDGRGLAVNRIKSKAMQLGMLGGDLSLYLVGGVIFNPGLSTAGQLSDISGRGVGLDAVRTLLEKAGGRIELKMGTAKDPQGDYFNFHLELIIPIFEQQQDAGSVAAANSER